MSLPEAEQQAPEWQAAIEVLMLIGENGGDAMIAHIGMMRALHRHRNAADLRNKIGLLRVGDAAELARAGKSMVIRATVAAPVQKLTQGGQINPLLEGATSDF